MSRLLLLCYFLFSISFIFPQNLNKLYEDYLITYFLNKRVPSVSAGVMNKGKIVWTSAKGFSDIENSVPAGNRTLYRVASISKSITAIALMQLFEAGHIKLDDDIRKYIPYLPETKHPFSIRQLLNHTSGIRSYKENEFDNKDYFSSTKDVVLYIMKDTLHYIPGEVYLYSTLGYNLLAAVIENVSGMSYSDYMKKYVFEPAGMTFSLPDQQKSIIQNRARGYIRDAYREIQNAPLADLSIKYAGGGILSTSEDLLKFSQALVNGKLLKQQYLDSMLVPTRLNNGKYINYGLGFSFGTDETGRKYFSHAGGGTGFSSNLVIYPEEKMSAVYLTNIRDRSLEDPAKALILITLGKTPETVKRSLADALMEEYLISNIDSILTFYNKLAADSSTYYVNKEELNYFGTDLLSLKRNIDAIEFFKFTVSLYPDYAQAYKGLGDAYLADGNKGLALKNYRIAIKLNPDDIYAAAQVKKINRIK